MKTRSDSENKTKKVATWEKITVRGQGEQGVTEDGITAYCATDGRYHFYKGKEWLCTESLVHHGLTLARWILRNK